MKISPTIEKKLADWTMAFNSIPDKQNQEAQILKDLIIKLQHAKKEERVTVCS